MFGRWRRLPTETSLVVAGFPCQDLWQAGKTGDRGRRSGLMGEVFRLIEAQRTPWVLLENVPFMLQLGRGKAMDVIAAAFEELGYSGPSGSWTLGRSGSPTAQTGVPPRIPRRRSASRRSSPTRRATPADAKERHRRMRLYWTEGIRGLGWAVGCGSDTQGRLDDRHSLPPAILMPDGRVVTPDIRDAERLQGFPDWTSPAEQSPNADCDGSSSEMPSAFPRQPGSAADSHGPAHRRTSKPFP